MREFQKSTRAVKNAELLSLFLVPTHLHCRRKWPVKWLMFLFLLVYNVTEQNMKWSRSFSETEHGQKMKMTIIPTLNLKFHQVKVAICLSVHGNHWTSRQI